MRQKQQGEVLRKLEEGGFVWVDWELTLWLEGLRENHKTDPDFYWVQAENREQGTWSAYLVIIRFSLIHWKNDC